MKSFISQTISVNSQWFRIGFVQKSASHQSKGKTETWNWFHCEISRISNFRMWVWGVIFVPFSGKVTCNCSLSFEYRHDQKSGLEFYLKAESWNFEIKRTLIFSFQCRMWIFWCPIGFCMLSKLWDVIWADVFLGSRSGILNEVKPTTLLVLILLIEPS